MARNRSDAKLFVSIRLIQLALCGDDKWSIWIVAQHSRHCRLLP